MADKMTFDDAFRIFRDTVLVNNGQLTKQAIEREGSDSNVLAAGSSAVGEEVIGQNIDVESGLYLDSAVGPALDRLVFDRYGLTRKPAAPSFGQVQFTTTAPNPSAFSIPANTVLQTSAGTQFTVTTQTSFPFASTGPVIVEVRSILAGSSQQAAIGTITNIVSQITGSPTDLVVTNTLATAGAADAETDDSLRNRARQFFTTARRGTKTALVQGALAVPGVVTAAVFEVLNGQGQQAGEVQLIVSDAFTDALAGYTTPPTYETQSQILATQVFNALDDVRAAGIFVDVIVASVVLQPVILHLAFPAGADTVAVTAQAKAVTVNYVNGLNPGQPFIVNDLLALLAVIPGLFYTGGEVALPNGNVYPTFQLQVLRTSSAIVTAPSDFGN